LGVKLYYTIPFTQYVQKLDPFDSDDFIAVVYMFTFLDFLINCSVGR